MKDVVPNNNNNNTPIRLAYEKKLMIEILNDLERIIVPRVEWKENRLEMAESVIEENQKIAKEIKRKLIKQGGVE